jgi:glycosyltransferase involved in cell wall biosynthesis
MSNSNNRLSIIVPTHDGEGILDLYDSASDQLLRGDELLIVLDTFEGTPEMTYAGDPTVRIIEYDAGHHCYGHCQINYGMSQAHGDYLIFIDDDDCFPDGALDAIRRAIAEQEQPRPLMFKFYSRRHGRTLPPGHYVQESAIGGHAMVVPNIPERLGQWGERYAGDFDFIQSTLALWPDGPAWYDDVIACA